MHACGNISVSLKLLSAVPRSPPCVPVGPAFRSVLAVPRSVPSLLRRSPRSPRWVGGDEVGVPMT